MELGRKYCDLDRWTVLLGEVAAACSLGPPTALESFPLSGGPTVIFRVGDAIVKFYTKDPPVCHAFLLPQ